MAIEAGLWEFLTADSGVGAVLGDRIYPLVIPQSADIPAAAYQRISYGNLLAHDGVTNYATVRIQITCAANSYDEARAAAAALREACDGYRGAMGNYAVHSCAVGNIMDGYNLDSGRAVVRLDIRINYTEV